MKNNWIKRGRIFDVTGDFLWNKTHAQVPIVDDCESLWRVYYSTRDLHGKSSISYVELSKNNPKEIIFVNNVSILSSGSLGCFDDSGVMPTSIIEIDGFKYLYYIGWTTRGTVPFSNSVGVAKSFDGGKTFERVFKGPVIGIDADEPYFTGTCNVINFNNQFWAYYLSCIGWNEIGNRKEPLYDIKIAVSDDGLKFKKLNKVAIPLLSHEGGIASASVVRFNNLYHMWFSTRGRENYRDKSESSYRIGYASSIDGIKWIRQNESVLKLSESGWDSEMMAYPFVITGDKELIMFYNGNGFGKTGFGYATMKLIE